MAAVGEWRGWAGRTRQLARSPHAQALAGCLLGVLALAEVVARLAWSRGGQRAGWLGVTSQVARSATSVAAPHAPLPGPSTVTVQSAGLSPLTVVVLFLVCLATTLPVVFLPRVSAVVVVCAAAALSLAGFGMLTAAGTLAVLIVLYRLGRRGSRALPLVLAAPFVVLALAGLAAGGGLAPPARLPAVLLASLAPVAALAGIARQAHGEATASGAARQAIAGTLIEHTARGERARIARELHDVVAHHISMIAVQAETARLATPGMPAAGAQRLLDIGDTARAALTEMRRLLGVLREDARAATPGEAGAELRPQPGLAQLNELLDAAREASGTAARLIVNGSPVALDPGVELAAYRIVQEALTNARRHAPGAAADVELHYGRDALRLRVRDNGPGPPSVPAEGHGLAGMRERAAAVGGELRTGADAGGGFAVEAELPVNSEAAG